MAFVFTGVFTLSGLGSSNVDFRGYSMGETSNVEKIYIYLLLIVCNHLVGISYLALLCVGAYIGSSVAYSLKCFRMEERTPLCDQRTSTILDEAVIRRIEKRVSASFYFSSLKFFSSCILF